MESGLEDRNNPPGMKYADLAKHPEVSMESGLEDRNNLSTRTSGPRRLSCLNGVRPRRPEQLIRCHRISEDVYIRLNGVRPRRPEQLHQTRTTQ